MRKFLPFLCAVLAGLAGLVTNLWRPVLFTNIEWALGGFFPLLAALIFGRWWGLLAGAIAFCLTPQYWFHPWGWLTYGAEPFVVAHLVRRHGRSVIGASFLHWLCFGTPIAAIYFVGYSYAAFPANYIALAKYPLNGLIVALIVQEVSNRRFFHDLLRRLKVAAPLPELRDLLTSRFSTLTALPLVLISFISFGVLDNKITRQAESRLRENGENLRDELLKTLHDGRTEWVEIVQSWPASGNSAAQRTRDLEAWIAQNPAWQTLQIVTTPTGEITSASAEGSARRDDPLTQPARFETDLVTADGTRIGRASASVDLTRVGLEPAIEDPASGGEITLIDRDRNPLLLPDGMDAYHLELTLTETLLGAVDLQKEHFTHDRWRSATSRTERFRTVSTIVPGTNWILITEEPLWYSQAEAVKLFLLYLGLAFASCGFIYLMSRGTAAEITQPLDELARHTAALAHGEVPSESASNKPVSAELSRIQHDVFTAAAILKKSNHELQIAVKQRDRSHNELEKVLGRLEQTVQARTADLQRALLAAEAADRTKGEFIGMMSHELRTPLNVMLGLVELLLQGQRGDVTPEQSHALRTIEENGLHLLSLIDDVLDFSRDESGKLTLHREDLDPADVCDAALRLISPHARRKQLRISTLYDHTLANLSADPKRMRQMVINLLTNAIKFTPVGGRIDLRVSEQHATNTLRISISDTGIGIPAGKLEEIFVPFHQLDRSLSREFEGSGLGLTLVRRLAHLHGGEVLVESAPDQGSTFHLDFPLPAAMRPRNPRESKASLPSRPSAPPVPESVPPHSISDGFLAARHRPGAEPGSPASLPPRVLIVEDNAAIAELLRNYLSIMGCDSWIASNGAIGVSRAAELMPDLILMDVQMPVMDGIEATRRICSNSTKTKPAPPIVMVTALASAMDRKRASEAGAVDYLTKPISMAVFIDAVTRHLGSRIAK